MTLRSFLVALVVVAGLLAAAPAGAQLATAPNTTGAAIDNMDAVGAMSALKFLPGSAEGKLLAMTRRWGFMLLVVSLVAGIIFELAMSAEAQYGVVVRRFVFALFLLTFYNATVGTMVNALGDIAGWLAPPQGALTQYMTAANKAREAGLAAEAGPVKDAPVAVDADGNPATSSWVGKKMSEMGSSLGSAVYNVLIYVIILLCEAILFIILLTGKVLVAILYILGPIAIALGVPRASGVSAKWFQELVTFASWPIFIALFLSLLGPIGAAGWGGGSVLGALVSAGIMAASAMSVPKVAGSLIGGGIGNIGEGIAKATQGVATGGAQRVLAGAQNFPGSAAAAAAAAGIPMPSAAGAGTAAGNAARSLVAGIRGLGGGGGGGASSSPPGGGGGGAGSSPP